MRPLRVLLPSSTPLSYAVARPIFARLAGDPRLALFVTARHGGARLARACLALPGLRYVPRLLAPLRTFDAAICPGFSFRSRRAGRLVQIFHGASPKNYAVSRDALAYDRLFLIGEYHRRKFVRSGWLAGPDDPRGIAIGMPKTDPLAAGAEDAAADATAALGRRRRLESLGLDPALPCVLYAPTRSGESGSSVDGWGLAALDGLAGLAVNVLVKLHDRSLRRFRPQVKDDFERAVDERGRSRRLRLVRDHDVIPWLLAADALVSDLSSVTNEFLLRDRPVIYLEVPSHEDKLRRTAARRFGDDDPQDLAWLRAAGETVTAPDGLSAAVERALADPGARSAIRRDRAAQLFFHPGRATDHAVAALYRELGIAAPEKEAAGGTHPAGRFGVRGGQGRS